MIVAIIDYGSGNLRSAAKAFERASIDVGRAGDKVVVTNKATDISSADRVILPGVGAFGDCRRGLYGLPGMVEALEDTVHRKGRPFLGICVGMQLMATRGLEHGEHAGLGWIEGEVVGITLPESTEESALKIPHMGWNDLQVTDAGHGHPLLAGLEGGSINQDRHVYFVHSYHLKCQSAQDILAQVEYGGPLTAMIGRDNMAGTQFHPEKSQDVGQTILRNFLNWSP